MSENQKAWGAFGDKLSQEEFVGQLNAQRRVFETMLDKLQKGIKVTLNPRPDELVWVLKVYDVILKNPAEFKPEKVKRMLAGLPNTLGGKYVISTKELAIHLEVAASYRDYSSILPKTVKDYYLPVQVIRRPYSKEWADVIVEAVVNKTPDLKSLERKSGIYVYCVGWASTIGGSVHTCQSPDGVIDVSDAPKFRCKACNEFFTKERAKARRGRVSDTAIDDVLDTILG